MAKNSRRHPCLFTTSSDLFLRRWVSVAPLVACHKPWCIEAKTGKNNDASMSAIIGTSPKLTKLRRMGDLSRVRECSCS